MKRWLPLLLFLLEISAKPKDTEVELEKAQKINPGEVSISGTVTSPIKFHGSQKLANILVCFSQKKEACEDPEKAEDAQVQKQITKQNGEYEFKLTTKAYRKLADSADQRKFHVFFHDEKGKRPLQTAHREVIIKKDDFLNGRKIEFSPELHLKAIKVPLRMKIKPEKKTFFADGKPLPFAVETITLVRGSDKKKFDLEAEGKYVFTGEIPLDVNGDSEKEHGIHVKIDLKSPDKKLADHMTITSVIKNGELRFRHQGKSIHWEGGKTDELESIRDLDVRLALYVAVQDAKKEPIKQAEVDPKLKGMAAKQAGHEFADKNLPPGIAAWYLDEIPAGGKISITVSADRFFPATAVAEISANQTTDIRQDVVLHRIPKLVVCTFQPEQPDSCSLPQNFQASDFHFDNVSKKENEDMIAKVDEQGGKKVIIFNRLPVSPEKFPINFKIDEIKTAKKDLYQSFVGELHLDMTEPEKAAFSVKPLESGGNSWEADQPWAGKFFLAPVGMLVSKELILRGEFGLKGNWLQAIYGKEFLQKLKVELFTGEILLGQAAVKDTKGKINFSLKIAADKIPKNALLKVGKGKVKVRLSMDDWVFYNGADE